MKFYEARSEIIGALRALARSPLVTRRVVRFIPVPVPAPAPVPPRPDPPAVRTDVAPCGYSPRSPKPALGTAIRIRLVRRRADRARLREPVTLKPRDPAPLRRQPARAVADLWPTPRCLSDALACR